MKRPTIDAAAPAATYRGIANASGGGAFYGIRYAAPPVAALRFEPPQPLAETPGQLLEAIVPLPSPPQQINPVPDWVPRRTSFATDEDCLNLNIFTPGCDDRKRPVIVHVFGGGFQTGSINGSYQDDEGFAAKGDIVLVRPNMRTGALGFLHVGPHIGRPELPANRGMLDLVMALQWVRRNIDAFGGNAENVTLLGMSSGAFTIAGLLGMDDVAGLFHQLWLMSGSASRIIDPQTALSMAGSFMRGAGLAAGDEAGAKALPLDDILEVQNRVVATDLGERNAPGGNTFGIVADGISLKCHPLDALKEGRWKDISLVASWSRDEARMWYAFGIMKGPEDRRALLGTIARFHADRAEDILAQYEARMPGATLAEIEERFLSDTIYIEAAKRTAQAQAKAGGRAFACEFAWVPRFEDGRLGSSHGFDEPFIFGNVEENRVPLAASDASAQKIADEMSEALFLFARTGAPGWSRFDEADQNFNVFGSRY